jgi:hypothetical protein
VELCKEMLNIGFEREEADNGGVVEDEEPDGCSTIQAALNAKNGLFLLTHEMQAASGGQADHNHFCIRGGGAHGQRLVGTGPSSLDVAGLRR